MTKTRQARKTAFKKEPKKGGQHFFVKGGGIEQGFATPVCGLASNLRRFFLVPFVNDPIAFNEIHTLVFQRSYNFIERIVISGDVVHCCAKLKICVSVNLST